MTPYILPVCARPLEINLREIAEVKRARPDRALLVSLMVPRVEEAWKAILPRVEATGRDGVELNFGCPHDMSERGLGAAAGQVPEYNAPDSNALHAAPADPVAPSHATLSVSRRTGTKSPRDCLARRERQALECR